MPPPSFIAILLFAAIACSNGNDVISRKIPNQLTMFLGLYGQVHMLDRTCRSVFPQKDPGSCNAAHGIIVAGFQVKSS